MKAKKVLINYVKRECANWEGFCLGATVLSTGVFNHTGKCHIMEGNACPYFEKNLIPMCKSSKNGEDALTEYRFMVRK